LTATALEPPKKSSPYLSGYASGFFVASALFRHNSQNANYGTFFTALLKESVNEWREGGALSGHD
jgi:hypothetical protein